jgi:hypothetical protein
VAGSLTLALHSGEYDDAVIARAAQHLAAAADRMDQQARHTALD